VGDHVVTSAADYHADPCPAPSLTASIANILINESPAHARAAHPRLNPNFVRAEESRFELGTVLHQLILEGIDNAHVVHADSWRTAAAKEARDEARAHGRVPLLAAQYDEAKRAVDAAQEQIRSHSAHPGLFRPAKRENTPLIIGLAGPTKSGKTYSAHRSRAASRTAARRDDQRRRREGPPVRRRVRLPRDDIDRAVPARAVHRGAERSRSTQAGRRDHRLGRTCTTGPAGCSSTTRTSSTGSPATTSRSATG
jgi:hypothetical protein